MLWAVITFEREFYHRWEDAPESEVFLRNLHRHILKIEVWIEQDEWGDRDIEYIRVKKELEKWIKKQKFSETASCEEVGKWIKEYVERKYKRKVKVKVMEDGENGCFIED